MREAEVALTPKPLQARRQEIAAEAERRTELLKEHLIIKVGSSEQKAEMILRQRAQEAEEVRLRKMEEVRSRQEVLNKNRFASLTLSPNLSHSFGMLSIHSFVHVESSDADGHATRGLHRLFAACLAFAWEIKSDIIGRQRLALVLIRCSTRLQPGTRRAAAAAVGAEGGRCRSSAIPHRAAEGSRRDREPRTCTPGRNRAPSGARSR